MSREMFHHQVKKKHMVAAATTAVPGKWASDWFERGNCRGKKEEGKFKGEPLLNPDAKIHL